MKQTKNGLGSEWTSTWNSHAWMYCPGGDCSVVLMIGSRKANVCRNFRSACDPGPSVRAMSWGSSRSLSFSLSCLLSFFVLFLASYTLSLSSWPPSPRVCRKYLSGLAASSGHSGFTRCSFRSKNSIAIKRGVGSQASRSALQGEQGEESRRTYSVGPRGEVVT